MAESSKASKARRIDAKARVRAGAVEIELSTASDATDIDQALKTLLDTAQSHLDRIMNIGTQLGQGASTEEPAKRSMQEPFSKMAADLGLNVDELKAARILGIKEDKPQILSPSRFPTPEKACLALFYCFEIGLDKSPITFEEGEEAYTMSRYSEPFAGRVLSNLKFTNKINRTRYDSAHEIVLTPSGIEDARDVLKAAIAGPAKSSKKRKKKEHRRKRT